MRCELEVTSLADGCAFIEQSFPILVSLSKKHTRAEWEAMTNDERAEAVKDFVRTSDRETLSQFVGALLASSPTITDAIRQFVVCLLDPAKDAPQLENLSQLRKYADGCAFIIGLKVEDVYKQGL